MMLRSRDNSKNAHPRTGIQTDEVIQQSSSTKYGILACVLFTIVIIYLGFRDSNTDIITSTVSTLKEAGNTGPKVLDDLNPIDTQKLQRLMHRANDMVSQVGGFQNILNQRAGTLDEEFGDVTDSNAPLPEPVHIADTKEVSFTLSVTSLPSAPGKQSDIFIRQSYPLNTFSHTFVLIFLHGAAYSSATWSELGILQSLAEEGYVSYALDVPNYGQSVQTPANDNKWLSEIIAQLIGNDEGAAKRITEGGGIVTAGKQYVLVTASMSGRYAMPLLLGRAESMIGMITVAPIGTKKYHGAEYEKVSIPVCIIYGEEDVHLGLESKENLIQIPNHKVIMVQGGAHAAYASDPKFFSRQVVKWLSQFD